MWGAARHFGGIECAAKVVNTLFYKTMKILLTLSILTRKKIVQFVVSFWTYHISLVILHKSFRCYMVTIYLIKIFFYKTIFSENK